MIKRIKYIISICVFLCSQSVFSQISELHLDDLTNCIPSKYKDTINSIEQSYKVGVGIYTDVTQNTFTDQEKMEKLISLFKIQLAAEQKLSKIWEQSDSISKENSSKYFTEASRAYKELTDTINLSKPNFKTVKSALVAVEKSHQVIILQKFGLQVLLGCVREGQNKLGQPNDIPDIVVNIDMIERFRKVWNDANAPMTYDQWVYKPTERKLFAAKSLADSYKDRFNEKKKDVGLNVAGQDISTQGLLATNSTNTTSDKDDIGIDKSKSQSDNIVGGKNNRTTGGWNNNGKNHNYSIKGEANHFEIKSLISQSRINTLGVDYFSIQIAASKKQLVIEKLKNELYCTNLMIEEKNEDGWYKYLIGHFSSVDSANKFLAKPCITRGFVSGYSKSKGRIAILSIKNQIDASFDTSAYSIVYRVQIAASRQPLSNELIATIYKGYNPVNVSQEDGWYRYSIGDFIYFNEAKITRDSCGTKDAFLMPYQNQKRIQWPRKDAMEDLKVKQNENSIYVVQVAASRKPLPLQIIRDIIKVDYPLTMQFEDGWYKYYISAFTNFTVAKEVAAKIGIKGAFIATYKNGLRIKP